MAGAKGDERAVEGIPVEVKFDNGGYYSGFLMDIINDEALIHFPCNWMPETLYPFSHVRFPPTEGSEGIAFATGMLVEILTHRTTGHYQAWFPCIIKDLKSTFCQFMYADTKKTVYDFVDICMVRTPNTNPHIAIDMFYTYSIPIPEDIREYAQMNNVHKTLKDAIKSALVNYDADTAELVIISRNAADIICAEILQKAHLRSLSQRTRVLKITGNLSSQLDIAKQGGFVEDVVIPPNLLGVAIGREKIHYNAAKTLEGIWLIHIHRRLNKFVIYGKTAEAVKEARYILEIRTEFYPIADNFLSQLVGRESGNIYSIIESTGAIEIRIPPDEDVPESDRIEGHIALAILGSNEVIERVKIFLEFQIDHIYEVQDLRKKRVDINEKVAEFFRNSQKCDEQLLSTQVNLTDRDSGMIQLTQVSPSGTNLSSFNIEELDDLEDLLLSDDEDDKIVILETGKQLNVSGETIEISSSENMNTIMTFTETDNTSEEFSGLQDLLGNSTDTEDKSKGFDCDRSESTSDDSDDVVLIEDNLCESIITIATATETDNISDEASGIQELTCTSGKSKNIAQEKPKEFDEEQTQSVEKDSKDNEESTLEDEKKLNVSIESTDSNDTIITIADTTHTSEELSRVQEALYRSSSLLIFHEKSTEFECDSTEFIEKANSSELAIVEEELDCSFNSQISQQKLTEFDGDSEETNKNLPEKTPEPLLLEQITTSGVLNSDDIADQINSMLLEAVDISNKYLEEENQQIDDAGLDEQKSSSSEFYDSIENSEGEHENLSRSLDLRANLASSINEQIESTIKAHTEMFKQFSVAQQKYDLTQTEEYTNSLQRLLDLQLKFATISMEISSENLEKSSIAVGTADEQLNTSRSIATQIEEDLEKKLDTKTIATQSETESKILDSKSVTTGSIEEPSSTLSKIDRTLIPAEEHVATPRSIAIQPITLKTVSTEIDNSMKIPAEEHVATPRSIAIQPITLKTVSTEIDNSMKIPAEEHVATPRSIAIQPITLKTVSTEIDNSMKIPAEEHVATPRSIAIQPITLKTVSTEIDNSMKIIEKNPSKMLPPPKPITVQTKTLPSSESRVAATMTKIPAVRKRKWRKLDQTCLKSTDGTENVGGGIAKPAPPIAIKMVTKASSAEVSRTVIPTKKYVEVLKSIPVNMDTFKKPVVKEQTRRVIEIQRKPPANLTPPEITITQLLPPPGYVTPQPMTPKVTSTVTKELSAAYVVTPKAVKAIPKRMPEIKPNVKANITERPSKVNEVEIKTSASSKLDPVQMKTIIETPRPTTAKAIEPKIISTEHSGAVKSAENSTTTTEASPPYIEVTYKKKHSAASKISRATAMPKGQENIKQRPPLTKGKHETTGMTRVQDKVKFLTPVEHKEKTSKKVDESVSPSKFSTPAGRRPNIMAGCMDLKSKQQVSDRSSSSSSQRQSATSTPETVIFDSDLSMEKKTLPSFIADSFQTLNEFSKASPHTSKYQVSQFMSRDSNINSPIDASGDTGAKWHDSTIPPTGSKKVCTEQQTNKSRLIDLLWRIGYKGPLLGEEVFKSALKGGLESLEFNVLVVYLTERLHGFLELQEHITPMLNEINSDIFTVELGEFLRQIRCPYEDLVNTDVNERLKKRQHRRLLIKFLASEVICNNLLHNDFQCKELQKYLNRNYSLLNRDTMIDILNLPVLPTENTVRALEERFNRYNDSESSSDDGSRARTSTKKDN